MTPIGAAASGPRGVTSGVVTPEEPIGDVPLQDVEIAAAGQINPYVSGAMPFVQHVAVPTSKNVAQGTYGVRVGSQQLAAQAITIKHRPNGNAQLLRVEGVWPANLSGPQTIDLTDLPPAVTSDITLALSSGTVQISKGGALAHTITPYAATKSISGSKPNNLKGSNTSAGYIPSIAFHEWHIVVGGSASSVGAGYVDLTIEEDTSIMRVYLARGAGSSNAMYEFQTRFMVHKWAPFVTFEHTTFKHFPTNTPGSPSSPSTMDALASERWTITPASSFTGAQIKSTTGSSLTIEASPFGAVSGSTSGSALDDHLNAVRLQGANPLSVAVRDLVGSGPSALRATTDSLVIDFWSSHTSEVFDMRGTGADGEYQGSSSDYNSSPRGNAKTWEGALLLTDALTTAQRYAARDTLWFATPAALEASQAYGPWKVGGATRFAGVVKRINALAAAAEKATHRHQHYGYVNWSLLPQYIPRAVNAAEDKYVRREPMKSGRYGQLKSTGAGWMHMHLYTGDRARLLRGIRMVSHVYEIAGVHRRLFGSQYAGSSRDGFHRRYRDPFTGLSNDTQYWLPSVPYNAYWAGGTRRILERAQLLTQALNDRGTIPYPQRIWANALRYQHSHDAGDLAELNATITSDVASGLNHHTPPSQFAGKIIGMFWGNFRWAGDTQSTVMEVYAAKGDAQLVTDMAAAYAYHNWTGAEPISAYGNRTGAYRGVSWALLLGKTASQVGTDTVDAIDRRIRDHWNSGRLAYHADSLPSGDPDTYTWADVVSYFGGQTEEPPVTEQGSFALLASYLDETA